MDRLYFFRHGRQRSRERLGRRRCRPVVAVEACARFAAAKYRAKSSFARETSGARSSGKSSRYSAAVSPKSSRNEASNEEGDDDDTPEDPDPDPESGSATATLARDSAAATDASSWGRREDKYSP